jgi:hypothetical protein
MAAATETEIYHLKKCIEANETYYPSEIPVDEINFTHDGTKIILGDLKKKRTAALSTFLKRRLARRFSIIGDQYHFSVRVDGNDVTAGDRNYLPKAQLLWIYPSESDNSFSAESTRPSGPTARSTRETCTPTRGRSARRS